MNSRNILVSPLMKRPLMACGLPFSSGLRPMQSDGNGRAGGLVGNELAAELIHVDDVWEIGKYGVMGVPAWSLTTGFLRGANAAPEQDQGMAASGAGGSRIMTGVIPSWPLFAVCPRSG